MTRSYNQIDHPRMVFFICFFAYTIGISTGILSDSTLGMSISVVIPLIMVLFWWWKKWYIAILCSLIWLSGWYMWHRDYQNRIEWWQEIKQITWWFSGSYQVEWIVGKLLYNNDLISTYRLNIDNIANRSTWEKVILDDKNIWILIDIPSNLHINSGDTIRYVGKITKVTKFPLEGFSGYSWYHHIYGKSVVPVFERIYIHKNSITQEIQSWSKSLIFRWFPEDIAGIILGMTIGNIELLTSETKASFTNAGITHILVVSGSNIAFVIVILTGILRYFPIWRIIRWWLVVWFVLAYGSLVWWDMPVVRAVSMWIITYIAIEWWKKASSISLLFLVWWGILIYSPLALVYDAGFGLSFAGTLGILLFHRSIGSYIQISYIPKWIIDIFSVTIAASIWSIVAIIYHFGVIPILSIFSNILISGVLGWILFASCLYLLFGLIGWWILYIWWWTIYIPTAYIMTVGKYFGQWYTYTIPSNLTEPISIFLIGILISSILILEKRRLFESE